METETGNLDPTSNFRLILIQTELERVKYLIRSYLRIRMHKVRARDETFPTHEKPQQANLCVQDR